MIGVFKEAPTQAQDPALSFYATMKPADIQRIQDNVTRVLSSRDFTPKPMVPGKADKNFIDNVKSAQVALGVEKLDGKWGRTTDAHNERFAQAQEKADKTEQSAVRRLADMVPKETALARASESPATAAAYNVTVRVSEVPGMKPREVTLRSNTEYAKMSSTEQKSFNERALRLAYKQEYGHTPSAQELNDVAAVIKHVKSEKMRTD